MHESVKAQTIPVTHFMVADGVPNEEVDGWDVVHMVLPRSHGDFGDTPRALGAMSALTLGHDAITFLDADNWFLPYHIDAMVKAHRQTGRNVCVASRAFHRLDGSFMYNETPDDSHADMNCIVLFNQAVRLVPFLALKPKALAEIDDRIFWKC